MSTYTAVATPAETPGWFVVHVPEIDQVTQARSEAEIVPMARDLVATWLQLPAGDVDITEVRNSIE